MRGKTEETLKHNRLNKEENFIPIMNKFYEINRLTNLYPEKK